MRKTLRGGNIEVLCKEKEEETSQWIHSRELGSYWKKQYQVRRTLCHKGGGIRPEQESGFMFAHLYETVCC